MSKSSYKKDKIIFTSFKRGYSVRNGKVYGPTGKSLGTVNSRGYITIGLLHKKKLYICSAHRVIWIWYNGIPKNRDLQINHIDGDKQNNRRWNLELVTPTLNLTHAIKTGLLVAKKAENKTNACFDNKTVIRIYKKYHENKKSVTSLAKEYKVSKAVIYGIASGKSYNSVTANLDVIKRKALNRTISKITISNIKKLRQKGFTLQKICDITGVSDNTVMKYWK